MKGKSFLDTNIFIYSFDQSDLRKQEIAKTLIATALESQQGLVSSQVVQEFIYAALRKFAVPLSPSECTTYIDTVFTPLCESFPSLSLYKQALALHQSTGYHFYDSLIVAAALEGNCTSLYTEDLQHGRLIQGVKIINPFIHS